MRTFKSYLSIFIVLIFHSAQAQHISNFQSVDPNGRNGSLVLPETHTFQKLMQNGDSMSGGATFSSATDFTGYVPINGSSINGYLSINNESNTGGVAILDINFNQNTKLWNVSQSKYVDFSAFGRTSKNCSGTVTPWGTIITSEEVGSTTRDINNDGYYDYGWQVEIDPKTKKVIDKRWAMGRFAHENATVHKNWRTVYQGEDSGEGFLYKFVSDFPGDLSSGKLYAYKGSKTGGSGQWIQVPNQSKNHRNNTHDYASNLGATEFGGIEDVEVGPDGLVYFTAKNENKIYCFQDSDPINGMSVAFLNKFAGDRNYTIPTANGNVTHKWGYGNDNLAFDNQGNLWVMQDGQNSHIWVVRKGHTENNPKVEVFATTPNGSEPTGITFSPDGRFIFLSIQHPSGFTYQQDAAGNSMRFNSHATIVIARKEFLGASCANNVCSTCNDGIRNFAEADVDCGGPCKACETCYDRIKNGNETGIDCGPGCADCPDLSVLKTDITCDSNTKGTAIAEVTGGSGNFTYLWSTGDTTSMINNLSAGNYSVKISDKNGNTQNQSFSISQSSLVNITYTFNNPSEEDASDGSINLFVSGGKSPYSYQWSNSASSKNLSNLPIGTYRVKVTDSNGCVAFTNIPLTLLDCSNFEVDLSKTDITCRNASDGSITALTAAGTAPFTYSWSNGLDSKTINNLSADNYSVTVDDANGCSATNSISIAQPSSFLNVDLNETAVSGLDVKDGSVSATAIGGDSPYAYEWSTGSTATSISNLTHGSYDVKVTDANGCSVFKTAIIQKNYTCTATINISFSVTDVICNGDSNGLINATVTGGTEPYTYQWSTGSSASDIDFLKPGNYNLRVTDGNGCHAYGSAIVEEPNPIEISTVYTNVTDSLLVDGSVEVTVTGGTGLYTYSWLNGETTNAINNLSAGNYEVTVTDQNLCEATKYLTIQPDTCYSVQASLSKNNASCNADGSIVANITGGALPYTYLWSNGAITDSISGLNGGIYSVEIRDSLGCLHTETIEIFESAHPLSLSTQSTEISAANATDGQAMVAVEGGTSPYTYSWSQAGSSPVLNNLSAGSYTVTVTDAAGCSADASVNVGDINCTNMSISLNKENGKCDGAVKAYILSEIEGAEAPLSYSWNNNATTAYLQDVSAGSYTVTVTDARGCSKNKSINVNEGSNFSVSVSGVDLSSYNSNDGFADLNTNGGNAPYSYQWSNGATGTSINNLLPGVYEVLVTDKNGCTAIDDTRIDNIDCANSNFKARLIYEHIQCTDANDGSIKVIASGGDSPYTYSWSGSNASGSTRSNLSPGNYLVTVTDSKNCSTSVTQNISEPAIPFTLSMAKTNETYYKASDGLATARASGGTPPYEYIWSSGGGGRTLSALPGGTYYVEVIDANGCSKTASVTIDEINCSNISLDVTANDVLCFDAANGTATASASGGTSPYHISWTNNGVGNSTDNLTEGIYEAYLIDKVGCTTFKELSIDEPTALTYNLTKNDISYVGQNDGSVSVTANNGTPPYSYDWDSGISNSNLNNLSAGSYTVTITDKNGCSESAVAVINDINCSTLNINALNTNHISCYGDNDGSITAQVNGGNTPYTYNWSNGGSGSTISGLSGGVYSISVTGNKGCQLSQSVNVLEPAELQVNLNTSDETFSGEADGFASININGGTTPYRISWSDGSNSITTTNLSPGNYTVTVEDKNDCKYTENFTINAGCKKVNNVLANGVTNTSAIINWYGDVNDGTYNLQYRNLTDGGPWQNTSTNQNYTLLSNLAACTTYEFGIYSICDPLNGTFVEFTTGGCNSCSASSNLYTLNITEGSAFLNWDIFPGATYTLYYRPGIIGKWNTYETDFSFAILFGLDDCQNYQWFIKTNCNGILSPNSANQQFTTACYKDDIVSIAKKEQLILKAHPNPVVDALFVELALNAKETTEYKIYDAAGVLHHQTKANESKMKFELAHLPKGLFTLYAKQGDMIESIKFIKE